MENRQGCIVPQEYFGIRKRRSIKDNSLNINERRDLFLYNTVTRTAKPKNDDSGGGSSTHTSSSGTTHGGGGGKF